MFLEPVDSFIKALLNFFLFFIVDEFMKFVFRAHDFQYLIQFRENFAAELNLMLVFPRQIFE